jgi:hypothetical protein
MGPLESPDKGSDILFEEGARRLYGKRDRQKSQDFLWNAGVSGYARAAPAFVRLARTRAHPRRVSGGIPTVSRELAIAALEEAQQLLSAKA